MSTQVEHRPPRGVDTNALDLNLRALCSHITDVREYALPLIETEGPCPDVPLMQALRSIQAARLRLIQAEEEMSTIRYQLVVKATRSLHASILAADREHLCAASGHPNDLWKINTWIDTLLYHLEQLPAEAGAEATNYFVDQVMVPLGSQLTKYAIEESLFFDLKSPLLAKLARILMPEDFPEHDAWIRLTIARMRG
jgi:hypothetical protein